MGLGDGTMIFEGLILLIYILLLACAVYIIYTYYICNDYTCIPLEIAESKAPVGSKEYINYLLMELSNNDMWAFPYIAATIITPLCLWGLCIPITLRTFAVLFVISFIVGYFMISIIGHQYIRPLTRSVIKYVEDNSNDSPGITLGVTNKEENHIITPEESDDSFILPIDIF